jgi:hypothetical protein
MCHTKLVDRGVDVHLNCEAILPPSILQTYHTNKVNYVAGHQLISTSIGTYTASHYPSIYLSISIDLIVNDRC